MINKIFFNDLDMAIVDCFSRKFGFSFELSNYILCLQKDKIEIQVWDDCSVTMYDVKIFDKTLNIFYLLFQKNEKLAKFSIMGYQKQKSTTDKVKFLLNLIENDFDELISLDYDKINTYFYYSDNDFINYLQKIKNV